MSSAAKMSLLVNGQFDITLSLTYLINLQGIGLPMIPCK